MKNRGLTDGEWNNKDGLQVINAIFNSEIIIGNGDLVSFEDDPWSINMCILLN